jgi:predicted nucleotidyltransferase
MRTFEQIRKDGDLLFESIRGSHLYGLNTEKSDIDTFGLYSASKEELLGTGIFYAPLVT